jgi:transcriptional regulator with XRE-family HTH domain
MQDSLSLFLKALRHENNKERLSDMAKKLEVSASFLSTVENGKRLMNDKLFSKLVKLYGLNKTQIKELDVLRQLEGKSLQIKTDELDAEKKDVVIKFLSNLDDLSQENLLKIKDLMNTKNK